MNRYCPQENNNMSTIKEEIYEMSGDTRYIKFSGDYEKFDK